MQTQIPLTLATIGALAVASQWLAWRLKLPAILFLLLAGIISGPVLGWLRPDALLGDLLFPIVSLGVAVILFEGALTLRLGDLRESGQVVRRLVTSGLIVTWLVTATATHWVLGWEWSLALLFGALMVVTGPTVVVPMLRTVRPTGELAGILRWEGILIDPLGALLAVLVFDFIVSGQEGGALGHTLLQFAQIVTTGLLLGAAGGYGLTVALRRYWIPDYLSKIITLALVFVIFALANTLQAESGLLAVTVMGLWVGNSKSELVEEILDFKENLSLLFISGLFIILAARVDLEALASLGWPAVIVFAVVQFVARPLKVALATMGSTLSWQQRALMAWIGPRGIIAAAMAALFSIRLTEGSYTSAALLVPLTFLVIIAGVLLQGASARPLAKALGVAEPEPSGFLLVGANPVARAIGAALQEHGVRTILADANWDHVRAARDEGLTAYFGTAVSEHADRHLNLVGIGCLLALSPRRDENTLAAQRYRIEFGSKNVYVLQAKTKEAADDRARVSAPQTGRTVFAEDVSWSKLSSLLSQGAKIQHTRVTEDFGFDAFRDSYAGRAILLFAVDTAGRVRVFTPEQPPAPAVGWTVISLIQPPPEASEGSAQEQTA